MRKIFVLNISGFFKTVHIAHSSENCLDFQETYPNTPPVWFADSEDPIVTNAVQILSNTQGRDNHVINQVSSTQEA